MNKDIKVLIVDDEETVLDVFKEYLETVSKYDVLTAKNGYEALEIIRREEISCCLTDLSMPLLDGLELTKRIHSYDRTIPVVVITGFPSSENVIGTLKNGVVDFLTKPIQMEQLPITIERAIRERSLFIDNILLKEEAKRNEKLLKINKELQGKIKEVQTMNLILQRLEQVTTSKELFAALVDLSADVTNCDEAYFYIHNQGVADPVMINSFFKDKSKGKSYIGDKNIKIIKKVANDGIPVLMRKNNNGSIMAIPLKIRSRVFGVLLSIAKNGRGCYTEKDLYLINFLAEKASFSIENLALYESIYENLFSTLYAFVKTIEARDPYTKQHSARVTDYAVSIAKNIGCSQEELDVLNVSGNLHDIGKIGIPDNILLKPGSLTDDEYEIIKKHPSIGSNIIGHFGMWLDEQKIIKHHHERWDGNGYPDRLKGKEIPFLSRILSVADVYDALTSDRSYRKKMSDDVAIKIIRENAGAQFDDEIVDVFLDLFEHRKIVS